MQVFFFFERPQLQSINLNVFYSFEVHFFVKFNIFQALLFSSCFSATTDAESALLLFSFFHLRRLKFCVVTVYIHKTNKTNKNICLYVICLSLYIYIYIYMRIYTHAHTYTHKYTYTYIYTYIYIYIYIYTHILIQAHIHQ